MVQKTAENELTICVVGLGYVGLPLALAFGRTSARVIGFDINQTRVDELKHNRDVTEEISEFEINSSKVLYTSNPAEIAKASFVIVAVPTPVTKANQPDLELVRRASVTVGQNLQKGAIVVYESTVYPGVTEEFCAPILEKESGLVCGKDFFVGYSPERINPGDKEHSLEKIVKVVSGMDDAATDVIAQVYEMVCLAGVFRAKNIKTAEAAKVIENTQRDLNIALMNELSLIFHRIGIDTHDVLEAAGTKWNFLKFTPGLVGGHCIGVDPYYLAQKAVELGYHPQVIAAGRRVNDSMAGFVADLTIRGLIKAKRNIQNAKVLVMGLTFKENVKDMRNSKIVDTIKDLQDLGVTVMGHDPLLSKTEIKKGFGVNAVAELGGTYDAIIIATAHKQFEGMEQEILRAAGKKPVIVDVRRTFPALQMEGVIYSCL